MNTAKEKFAGRPAASTMDAGGQPGQIKPIGARLSYAVDDVTEGGRLGSGG